eukprot:1032339-Prorocentrum_minimum.AAC.1
MVLVTRQDLCDTLVVGREAEGLLSPAAMQAAAAACQAGEWPPPAGRLSPAGEDPAEEEDAEYEADEDFEDYNDDEFAEDCEENSAARGASSTAMAPNKAHGASISTREDTIALSRQDLQVRRLPRLMYNPHILSIYTVRPVSRLASVHAYQHTLHPL